MDQSIFKNRDDEADDEASESNRGRATLTKCPEPSDLTPEERQKMTEGGSSLPGGEFVCVLVRTLGEQDMYFWSYGSSEGYFNAPTSVRSEVPQLNADNKTGQLIVWLKDGYHEVP